MHQSNHIIYCFCRSLKVHNEVDGSGGQAGPAGSEEGGSSAEGQPAWVNSLVGRIFWDFLREKYWTDQVAQKIQKKLSKIKVRAPQFLEVLSQPLVVPPDTDMY